MCRGNKCKSVKSCKSDGKRFLRIIIDLNSFFDNDDVSDFEVWIILDEIDIFFFGSKG